MDAITGLENTQLSIRTGICRQYDLILIFMRPNTFQTKIEVSLHIKSVIHQTFNFQINKTLITSVGVRAYLMLICWPKSKKKDVLLNDLKKSYSSFLFILSFFPIIFYNVMHIPMIYECFSYI